MKVAEFLAQLREQGTVTKLSLTTTRGEYLLNDERHVSFQIQRFGKTNEEVIAIEGLDTTMSVVNFPHIPEITANELELYHGAEHIDKNGPQELPKEKTIVEEIIKEVEVPIEVEKIVVKEVPKLIEVPILKEKIIYKDRILPWKIKIV